MLIFGLELESVLIKQSNLCMMALKGPKYFAVIQMAYEYLKIYVFSTYFLNLDYFLNFFTLLTKKVFYSANTVKSGDKDKKYFYSARNKGTSF